MHNFRIQVHIRLQFFGINVYGNLRISNLHVKMVSLAQGQLKILDNSGQMLISGYFVFISVQTILFSNQKL